MAFAELQASNDIRTVVEQNITEQNRTVKHNGIRLLLSLLSLSFSLSLTLSLSLSISFSFWNNMTGNNEERTRYHAEKRG